MEGRKPTLAEEHPSLQTRRLVATMAVTMTLEEEFPLAPPPPPPPPPHPHSALKSAVALQDEWPPNSFHLLQLS